MDFVSTSIDGCNDNDTLDTSEPDTNAKEVTMANYTITVIGNSYANVSKNGFGFCESFYGNTFKADAIRYVKKVGGKSASFVFVDHKIESFSKK